MRVKLGASPTELVRMALLMGMFGGFGGADACHALSAQIALGCVGIFLAIMYFAMCRYNWQVSSPSASPTTQNPMPPT